MSDSESFKPNSRDFSDTPSGVSRRALLKGTAGAAIAGLAGTMGAQAQVTGVMPGGGTIPFRLPAGSLDYLDPNQYIHNMEIHTHVSGRTVDGGEPLMGMWARGAQRMLPVRREGWMDISDARNPEFVSTGSTHMGKSCVVYNTELRKWIAVESASPPIPRHTPQYPHGQYHDEWRQERGNYSGLRGIRTWDVSDPASPITPAGIQYGGDGQRHPHEFLRRWAIRLSRCGLG